MDIQYRTGRKEDCLRIARLINIASGGVVEYIFHGLVPDHTPTEIIAHNLKRDHGPYSYKNSIVAEHGQKIVGVALSFPSDHHQITEEMKQFLPKERLAHLEQFYASHVEGSLLMKCHVSET